MRTSDLITRSVKYYWRTNLPVVFGVATAVAVLAGALLVGTSVRASLRDLFLQRLGQTDHVIVAPEFVREQLAEDIRPAFAAHGFANSCPLIELEGTVSRDNGARAGAVRVYGVDRRFWKFHGLPNQTPPENRELLVSESLARELDARPGDSLLIRIQKPSDVPLESLFGRKDEAGVTLRLTIREALSPAQLGEFSTRPQQGGVRAVFVPLQLLQKELGQANRVNTIVVSSSNTAGQLETEKTKALTNLLRDTARLEDYNIKLHVGDEQKRLSVEAGAGVISETLAQKVKEAAPTGNASVSPYLSYLVNSMRLENGRAVPYSIVTAVHGDLFEAIQLDEAASRRGCDVNATDLPPLILNEWAANDLGAKLKDRVTLDYYVWLDQGRLTTRSNEFRLTCIIPMEGLAADRNLVPDYPGITESESVADWDPPFPMDLDRIRPQDEDYWKKYRTSPKAFIPLGVGQQLWQSRFGKLTSMRIYPGVEGQTLAEMRGQFEQNLHRSLEPAEMGLAVLPVRAEGLAASRGATDFGEYFLYFSFFLVVSALLLASLFFKFGIEQRLREIGTLQAIGFPRAKIRNLFLVEGVVLSFVGSLLGLLGAVAYGYVILLGLRTWWVDAVGTTQLRLHVSPLSLALGGIGGVLAAVICIAWTLRRLGKASSRSLLAGTIVDKTRRRQNDSSPHRRVPVSPRLMLSSALTALALLILVAAIFKLISQTLGFFGSGTLLLAGLLYFVSAWLRRPRRKTIRGQGWPAVWRLGFRNAVHRPSRSVMCIALIAMSAFVVVTVEAFRKGDQDLSRDRKSGTGGFPLMAESLLPLVHDPNSAAGREALNIANDVTRSTLSSTSFARFRLRPGDDASCLNLYQPRNPRILGATAEFIQSNRFTFQNSMASSADETGNPWLLLNRRLEHEVVPVIADANSLTYVLHLKVGDEFVLNRNEGPVRLRVVGALSDSIFQSELLMSEENFVKLFPAEPGYRYFLIDAEGELPTITVALEDRLSDYGFDVSNTGERLANFHRVENTYLSTFQMLGGLGLALGTLGMAAVLLRNVLERRKELALLRALGYNSSHFSMMVIAENAFLLIVGLGAGTVCALVAIAPVIFDRGGRLPNISLGVLLVAVLICGLAASLVATWVALRSPLLPALRAE